MTIKNTKVTTLRLPRRLYARLYELKGLGKIKSLQDFIVKAIEEALRKD